MSARATVCCVWVRANVPYTAEYVVRLAAMVRRWIDRPYRFVCLTDRPEALPAAVETVRIPWAGDLPGWWAKVGLFDPALGLTGRVLALDLDVVIVAALGPILDYPAAFALAPHAGTFAGRDGRSVVPRFNSSVMVWEGGTETDLYTRWSPAVARRLWGDQDWIGEQRPDAVTLPAEWFPRISTIGAGPVPPAARVVLVKTPKNAEAARRYRWVREAWA